MKLNVLNNINNYILLILINTMGRGAHAAHAAYNGSGTQGISVTNEINENEDIHSVFITQNDTSKQILHGHNISEMTCAGKTEGITSERYKIFTPDENSDMLGDVYLNFEMDSEINEFAFVDTAQSTEYPLENFQIDTLRSFLTVGGSELKSMEIDLTTREVPPVESLTLNMRTVNKIKTFNNTSGGYNALQFAVGEGYYNLAWRHFGPPSPGPVANVFFPWNYIRIPQFVDINDIIYDPLFKTESDTSGSIIFGGYLQEIYRGKKSGLYFIRISDLILFEQGLVAVDRVNWNLDIVQELALRSNETEVFSWDYSVPEENLNLYTRYITVNTLNYIPGDEAAGFIVSGKIYNDPNIDTPIFDRYYPNTNNSYILKKSEYDPLKYTITGLKFDMIHDAWRHDAEDEDFDSEREVSSILSINDNGIQKTLLSCGTRYNTMLGLDTSGLIIRSDDNGETWKHVEFYYGSLSAANNTSTELDSPSTRPTAAVGDLDKYDLGVYEPRAEDEDKGIFFDFSAHDPNFKYFMPKVSQLHTNDTGVWTAIGQQGIQSTSNDDNDKYRQFVFRSIDDGETWHPIRLLAYPDNRQLNRVQFNSVLVDYVTVYSTDKEDCKVLMSVPPNTVMISVNEESPGISGMAEHGESSETSAQTYNKESYVSMTIFNYYGFRPTVAPLPVIGFPPYYLGGGRLPCCHMITPYYHGAPPETIRDTYFGLYDLTDLWNPSTTPTLNDIKYTFLGAISDGSRDILFGKNEENSGSVCGIATITSSKSGPENQENPARYGTPIKTITVKLGTNRIIQNMVYTKLGITAILKDSSNSIKYEIFQSSNGIEWKTLKVIEDLDDNDPIFIKSDLNSIVIYSYKSTNGYYRIFKITPDNVPLEIDSLQNELVDIKGLNYACTEWIITGKRNSEDEDEDVVVKSYDTIKWRAKVVGAEFPNISSVVVKDNRLYEPLVILDVNTSPAKGINYKLGNFKSYEVCHSASFSVSKGGGIAAYVLPDVNVSHVEWRDPAATPPSTFPNGGLIQINSLAAADAQNTTSTNVNDIIEITDGTIILCGENKPLIAYEYFRLSGNSNIHYNGIDDFINLAEGPGNDGLTFVEASSVYKPSGGGTSHVGMTKLAKTFYSLHEINFSENSCLAIGKNWYDPNNTSWTPDGTKGSIEEMETSGFTSEGLLALRYIPDPKEFPDLTGYYWKFIFGPHDPNIKNLTTGTWNITRFETIHDVYTNDKREIVVVGNPKNGKSPIFYEKPDTETFKVFRDDWYEIPIEYHGFSEVLSVCYTGTRWIFVGVPISKWMLNGIEVTSDAANAENINDGKILAHTTDLLDPDTWVIENFAAPDLKPFNVIKETNTSTLESYYRNDTISNVSSWRGNHVRPVNYKLNSGVIINVSFYDDDATTYNILQEKVYFMYEDGSTINIYQNDSFPEPTLIYRNELSGGNDDSIVFPWTTEKHGGEQFRPTWETYINNEIRTLFNTVYKHSFNQYVVDYNNKTKKFFLNLYSHPYSIDFEGWGINSPWVNRYRKFITMDTFSLRNRIEGNCYKIEQVKNENFITGVDSARYLAVGKGISSPIVKSDDLINWTDVDVKDIFTIVFDISHKSGLWVAIGEGNYNLAISKDGKNWTGIYTKYQSDTLSSDYSTAFNSLDYYNNTDNNVTDVLPYVPNLKGIFLRNLSLLRLFSRVEYHVGTQIWQTLTFDDIKAMLDTEFGAGEYKNLLKNCSIVNKNGSTRLTTWIPGFTKTLNSKLETFSNISESGSFPSGLLKDQKLSIKIYYNKLENVIGDTLESSDMNNAVFDNFMNNTLIPCDRNPNYFIDSFLADNYGFQLGDTYKNVNGKFRLKYKTEIQKFRLFSKRFELDDIEIDQFNRGVKQTPKITQGLYFDADNVGYLLLDLDSFNLYASHIIVSGWLTSGVHITDMNLELNGYSYQKVIEPSVIDYATKSYLGLNYNRYTFNGVDKEDGTGSLVIPLASTAYSGSSIPLDRYNSIRLRINFNTLAGPRSYINVTCVGTTTVSYNNSTANIEMY